MRFLLALLLFVSPLCAEDLRVRTLYSSLDQESISDSFAFYRLYPDTPYGKQALDRAFALMNKHRIIPVTKTEQLSIPEFHIEGMISMVNKMRFDDAPVLTTEQIHLIEQLASHLKHHKIKGHNITQVAEVEQLAPEDIDLARALLVYQFEDSKDKMHDIRQYEANLDMMALQILARLPKGASNLEKIKAINHFIFHEMRFRFPPESLSIKDIDTYTYLPSVLDSRLGVCLGVSILYLSLAQRLDLPLEIKTPPGHIYLSYVDVDGNRLNIETTARGIHVPEEHYFGMNTVRVKTRNLKETVGLSFFNQASVLWEREEHEQAVKLYEQSLPYMGDDPLLHLFLGLNYLFTNRTEEGKQELDYVINTPNPDILFQDTLARDYLAGKVSPAGLKAIFLHVDETRASILKKQAKILAELKRYPKFREGWFHLGITWLQLSRTKEALEAFEHYHSLEANNPTSEYYLAMLHFERINYQAAFEHLKKAHKLTVGLKPQEKILQQARFQLKLIDPQYQIRKVS